MMLDALAIAIIQTTPFTFRDDCIDVGEKVAAYHRIENNIGNINLCPSKDGAKIEYVVHEVGHELHYRIKQDSEYAKLVQAWTTLNEMSSSRGDYVSQYAMTNEKEDFADTYEEYYTWNFKIPERQDADWISPGVSNIQYTKFLLMKIIIDQASKDPDILSK